MKISVLFEISSNLKISTKSTSYLASKQAQHSSCTFDMKSSWFASSSQKSLLNGPSSMYQTSRCSMIVARKVTQPLPGSGAVQFTWISFLTASLVCVTTLPQISLVNESSSVILKVPCLTGEKSYSMIRSKRKKVIESLFLIKWIFLIIKNLLYLRIHVSDVAFLLNCQKESSERWSGSISTSNRITIPLQEN